METITDRLLREESKLKEKEAWEKTNGDVQALALKQRFGTRSPRCKQCRRIGHVKICNDLNLFMEYSELGEPQEITLGDGRPVQASDKGIILLGINLTKRHKDAN